MTNPDWSAMLDELLGDESDTMNGWEVEFVESLARQRDTRVDFDPTGKQFDRLLEIWQKVFR